MKNIFYFTISILLLSLFSCGNPSANDQNKKDQVQNLVEIQIQVEGMTCEGCENTVNTELAKLDGVVSSVASHVDQVVIVKADTAITSVSLMKSAIENVGYTVVNQ